LVHLGQCDRTQAREDEVSGNADDGDWRNHAGRKSDTDTH
jgi:hypothetical protein